MRFLFRRKGEENESDGTDRSTHSGLGIFSPVTDPVQPDPLHECRRLAELNEIFIRSKSLMSLDDVPFIVDQIRNGNIVLLDIKRLNDGREQTHLELKRIIERIRGETRSYRADIALVNDSTVIVAPSFVRF
ncbi:MAG: cell division protein SepF [Candidatus Thorarchaeota archaeon]